MGGLIVNEQARRATTQAIRYEEAVGARAQGQGRPRSRLASAVGDEPVRRRRRGGSGDAVRRPRARAAPVARHVRAHGRRCGDPARHDHGRAGRRQDPPARGVPHLGGRPRRSSCTGGKAAAFPYGDGITFWALGEIVKAHAGILESDGPAEAAAKLGEVVARWTTPSGWKTRLGPLVGLAGGWPDRSRRVVSRPGSGFIESIAPTEPLILLFEDLHWADHALARVRRAARRLVVNVPILVALHGPARAVRAALRLGRRQAQLDDGRAVVRCRRTRPHGSSPGSSRLLSFRRRRRPRCSTGQAATRSTQRSTLRLFLEARLRHRTCRCPTRSRASSPRGSTRCRPTVSRCSRTLPSSARSSGQAPSRPWARRESRTRSARAFTSWPARSSSAPPGCRLSRARPNTSFWHALIRDVAYGQIPRSARAAKHEAAADWLEEMAGERLARPR